jgi:hypothetical protein
MKHFTISYTDGQTWYNHEMDQTSVIEHMISVDALDEADAIRKLHECIHGSIVNVLKVTNKG